MMAQRRRSADDSGFTMAEMMVALGVFSALAVISGAAMLSVFSGIRSVSAGTEVQVESANSAVWISRLLRYAATPPGTQEAFTVAGPETLTFTTWAGAGTEPDVPYRVRLGIVATPEGTQQLVSDVAPGELQQGSWTWSGNWGSTDAPVGANRRILLEVPGDAAVPVQFTLWACQPSADCAATARDATPTNPGAISLNEGERLFAVDVVLGDTDDPLTALTQRVGLVNLR
jgi:prepilin-type N-terminal cleavage/methylation domain-containing protein